MKYKDHLIVGGLLVATIAGIVALVTLQPKTPAKRTPTRDLSALSAKHASTTTTSTEPPTTTTTAPPTVELDRVGEAPIERLSVDLAGRSDRVAPTVSVPRVSCTANRAELRVTASDNVGVTRVSGQHSTANDDAVEAVTFTPSGTEWRATVTLRAGAADSVTITASDGNGNTRSRTATNLCA